MTAERHDRADSSRSRSSGAGFARFFARTPRDPRPDPRRDGPRQGLPPCAVRRRARGYLVPDRARRCGTPGRVRHRVSRREPRAASRRGRPVRTGPRDGGADPHRSRAPTPCKHRFVPPALRGEEIWCQLYSEPGAGSDLAGLTTRAVRRRRRMGDHRTEGVDLQAHLADLGILLARTDFDVPKHSGITMFVAADAPAGRHRPPPRADDRCRGVQRGLPRRGPSSRRLGRRRRQRRLGPRRRAARPRTDVARPGQLTDDENEVESRSLAAAGQRAHRPRAESTTGSTIPLVRDDLAVGVHRRTARALGNRAGACTRRSASSGGRSRDGRAPRLAHVLGGADRRWPGSPTTVDADYLAYHVLNCRGMSLGGGHRRDPEEHPRRAGAGPPPRTGTGSEHALLRAPEELTSMTEPTPRPLVRRTDRDGVAIIELQPSAPEERAHPPDARRTRCPRRRGRARSQSIGVVLLCGAGGAFCSGLDLTEYNADPPPAWLPTARRRRSEPHTPRWARARNRSSWHSSGTRSTAVPRSRSPAT